MINVNDSNFKSTISAKNVTIVEFSAEWCAPCKALKPTLMKISEENQEVTIGTLDVDDNPNTSVEYNIRNIPTTIFFKDGKEVHKMIGNITEPVIKSKISELLN